MKRNPWNVQILARTSHSLVITREGQTFTYDGLTKRVLDQVAVLLNNAYKNEKSYYALVNKVFQILDQKSRSKIVEDTCVSTDIIVDDLHSIVLSTADVANQDPMEVLDELIYGYVLSTNCDMYISKDDLYSAVKSKLNSR